MPAVGPYSRPAEVTSMWVGRGKQPGMSSSASGAPSVGLSALHGADHYRKGDVTAQVGPLFRLLEEAILGGSLSAPDDAGRRPGRIQAGMGKVTAR